MDVNFELYKIFYHAAETGSFSEAARKLFISQSAVSQAIKNLEDRLSCKLFFRKSRSTQLTAEGKLLMVHISQAFNLIKAGESKLEAVQNLSAGEVRIGAGDTVCKYLLVPCMQRFTAQYPGIRLQVVNRTSAQILELLKNGNIDLGIITLPVEDPAIHTREFAAVDDIFVASEKYHTLKNRTIDLRELADYPLLMLEKNSNTRRNMDHYAKELGIRLTPEIELESVDLLVEFARIGLGISHVLKESAANAIAAGELFQVATIQSLPLRHLAAAWVADLPLSRAAQEFFSFLAAR